MEAEMKMVFQQKVQEKEAKLKQSEEELYARHREMKEALEKQRADLEDKKRRLESGRPLTPEKASVSPLEWIWGLSVLTPRFSRTRRRDSSGLKSVLEDGFAIYRISHTLPDPLLLLALVGLFFEYPSLDSIRLPSLSVFLLSLCQCLYALRSLPSLSRTLRWARI